MIIIETKEKKFKEVNFSNILILLTTPIIIPVILMILVFLNNSGNNEFSTKELIVSIIILVLISVTFVFSIINKMKSYFVLSKTKITVPNKTKSLIENKSFLTYDEIEKFVLNSVTFKTHTNSIKTIDYLEIQCKKYDVIRPALEDPKEFVEFLKELGYKNMIEYKSID